MEIELLKDLTGQTSGQYYSAAKPAAEALKIHSQFLPGSLAVCTDLNPATFFFNCYYFGSLVYDGDV